MIDELIKFEGRKTSGPTGSMPRESFSIFRGSRCSEVLYSIAAGLHESMAAKQAPARAGFDFQKRFSFHRLAALAIWAGLAFSSGAAFAQATNSAAAAPLPSAMPEALGSLGRVMLALGVVLGVFFGGVWLVRNWQRLILRGGRAPRLNVLETRSLGGRQAIYVVGYQQERFLIASSSAGVSLLSHLQSEDAVEAVSPADNQTPRPSFAQALTKVLKGK